MKKLLMAIAVAVLMSAPAFAAPQSYTLDVNTMASSSPAQQESQASQQKWRGQVSSQPGQMMQEGQMMKGQCQKGMENCPHAKMMKASGQKMKKGTASKKRMQKPSVEQPASETSPESGAQ